MNDASNRGDVSLRIHLMGRPAIADAAGAASTLRSRKCWSVLALLLLSERPPSRSQLTEMLFAEADDPGRALRWCLTQIRSALGPGSSIEGDPVVLRLPDHTVVDAVVVAHGSWIEAVGLTGLGAPLLEGAQIRSAPVFDTWLLSQQRHLAAASEAILHEAALGSMSVGALEAALGYAVRLVALNPLDENNQALLIRLYRLIGDDAAAARQLTATRALFDRELGVTPGTAVETAARDVRYQQHHGSGESAAEALVEAGTAAVSAGALDAGVRSLRTAVRLADETRAATLRINARLSLAEAYIHALGGLDEEGLAQLYEADEIARAHDLPHAAARARSELGYVDFLRARYDRAERWLTDALRLGGDALSVAAKATTYLGAVASDRGDYPRATALLTEAAAMAASAGEPRRQAFALSMLGRVALLRGELAPAMTHLEAAIMHAERDHWLAFLPWPQSLLGETRLLAGDLAGAADDLDQAFARACQLGDPCWEGMSARGTALVAEARGDVKSAFAILVEARVRANRLADPYVWLDGYILDAQATLGRRHGHSSTRSTVEALHVLASRTGMRDLLARAMLHGAALGAVGEADAAALLAGDLESPPLAALVALSSEGASR